MPVRRYGVLALLILACSAVPTFAQSSLRGGSLLPQEQMLNRFGLTRAWWGHGTIDSRRDKLLHMTVDESNLYLQSSGGTVTAFNAENGKHLWTRPVGQPDRAVFQAITNDDTLFLINGLVLYAVKKSNGDIIWELPLPGQPSSSPAADDKRIYIGFLDGSLYAFDLKIVQQLHSENKLPAYSFQAITWRYRTSTTISAPPVPGGNVVAFANRNGSLYSVAAEDRRLAFQFETDAALSAPIIRYKNTLLLASEDYNFYSLDLRNGRTGWQYTAGMVIQKAPVLIGDEVFLLPVRGGMIKLSAETGKQIWIRPRIEDFLSATTRHIYTTDRSNNLVLLSRATGEPEGSFSLDRFTKHLTNERSDRIFIATEGGFVCCLHETGRDFPRFHRYPDRQPLLPDFAPDEPASEPAADSEMPAGDNPTEGTKPKEGTEAKEGDNQ